MITPARAVVEALNVLVMANALTDVRMEAIIDAALAERERAIAELRAALEATMEFCILQEHADIVKAALAQREEG